MREIDLLASLPKVKRNIEKRKEAKDPEAIKIAKLYGEQYFDGPRSYGYGGYKYDGRWIPVAKDFVKYFDLKPGDRVLDIGCAKGFLVKDLMIACPGLDVYGLDISTYAIKHSEPEVVGRLHIGDGRELPFPDNSFDCVISLNTLHNFSEAGVVQAINEINRVLKNTEKAFIQVDSYRTPEQKEIFESWVLTAEFHDYPDEWIRVFNKANYKGDYNWTIIE